METGKLTVVIPHFMHHELIGQALDSISRQTYKPDKILIIDDGSTEESFAEMKRVSQEVDLSITIQRNTENRGVIQRLNDGLSWTDTEFVTFLAADDYVDRELYKTTVCLLVEKKDAALCGVGVSWVDQNGTLMPRPGLPPSLHMARYFPPEKVRAMVAADGSLLDGNGTVYRTELLREAGGYDPQLNSFTDGYVMHILAMRYGMCFDSRELATWRRLSGSYAHKSAINPDVVAQTLERVKMLAQSRDRDVFGERTLKKRFLARVAYQCASGMAALMCDPDLADEPSQRKKACQIYFTCLGLPALGPLVARSSMPGYLPKGHLLLSIFAFCTLRPFDVYFAVKRRILR